MLFTLQDVRYTSKMSFILARIALHWQDVFALARCHLQWQDFLYTGKMSLHWQRFHLHWQDAIYTGNISFTLARCYLHWQNVIYTEKMLFTLQEVETVPLQLGNYVLKVLRSGLWHTYKYFAHISLHLHQHHYSLHPGCKRKSKRNKTKKKIITIVNTEVMRKQIMKHKQYYMLRRLTFNKPLGQDLNLLHPNYIILWRTNEKPKYTESHFGSFL